ncbi:MAG: phosphate ABC transporter permease subunit PstC [Bacteroidota bacterium]|nr:phosphate ABC transporter permease subunit PstC [Bacteroidota bacterium]
MVNKPYRKTIEKIVEGVLFSSSTVTSITVIFIIIFLFNEGIGLFRSKPVEPGYFLAVNKENPVKKLSAEQIDLIFNQDVTNWKKLGGKNDTIILLTLNNATTYFNEDSLGTNLEHLPEKINQFVNSSSGVIAFFPETYQPINFRGSIIPIGNVKVGEFLTNKNWYPTNQPAAQLGILPLILGTLWVSLGAILFALPLGLATAIYMAEVADKRLRNILKPIIELLAGIPSVVYGFFGLVVIVPLVQKLFNLAVGETALVGSIILGIMALPTIITIAEDAILTTPQSLKEASLALGASRWQTMVRVVIPYAKSGIAAAIILGIGRAVGETMAVLMVTGNASVIPHSFLQPVRTIPATIAAELGEAPAGGLHYKALFALGIVLFIITFVINLSVDLLKSRSRKA